MLEKGHVPRGYLGIGAQPVAIPDALRIQPLAAGGPELWWSTSNAGGPADKAGLLLGDILVGIRNAASEEIEDLQSFSDSGVIGKAVKAQVVRAGVLHEVEITIGESPGK